jgi:hypothetical protein
MGKIFLVFRMTDYYSDSMFRICKDCDFEWHSEDGGKCPVCEKKNNQLHNGSIEKEYEGRAFGTSQNKQRINTWYTAIAIIAVVVVIYSFVLGKN